MAAGFGLLGLSPQAFWAMTPREIAAAISTLTRVPSASAAPTRSDLDRLMQLFPDTA